MKIKRALLIGIAIWIIAILFYSISYYVPILKDADNQANVVHSGSTGGQLAWPAMLRKAYRLDPSFAK